MNDNELQQLMLSFFKQAQEGKFTKFHVITNWSDYKSYKKKCKSYKVLVKILKRSIKRLYTKCCNEISEGVTDINKLIAYKQLELITKFYENEICTITEMLQEYRIYLLNGYYFNAVCGAVRSVESIIDFRRGY